jgi:hypothetical protein
MSPVLSDTITADTGLIPNLAIVRPAKWPLPAFGLFAMAFVVPRICQRAS